MLRSINEKTKRKKVVDGERQYLLSIPDTPHALDSKVHLFILKK